MNRRQVRASYPVLHGRAGPGEALSGRVSVMRFGWCSVTGLALALAGCSSAFGAGDDDAGVSVVGDASNDTPPIRG